MLARETLETVAVTTTKMHIADCDAVGWADLVV